MIDLCRFYGEPP